MFHCGTENAPEDITRTPGRLIIITFMLITREALRGKKKEAGGKEGKEKKIVGERRKRGKGDLFHMLVFLPHLSFPRYSISHSYTFSFYLVPPPSPTPLFFPTIHLALYPTPSSPSSLPPSSLPPTEKPKLPPGGSSDEEALLTSEGGGRRRRRKKKEEET